MTTECVCHCCCCTFIGHFFSYLKYALGKKCSTFHTFHSAQVRIQYWTKQTFVSCTNDLNNVAFIALAVVMIFSLVRSHSSPTFMSAMGEQYIIFLVFFFIFTFSGLNESLLVCCKIVIFNSKSSSSYTEFYCKMVTSNAISHMNWTYQHRYLCDLGSIVHHESPWATKLPCKSFSSSDLYFACVSAWIVAILVSLTREKKSA